MLTFYDQVELLQSYY